MGPMGQGMRFSAWLPLDRWSRGMHVNCTHRKFGVCVRFRRACRLPAQSCLVSPLPTNFPENLGFLLVEMQGGTPWILGWCETFPPISRTPPWRSEGRVGHTWCVWTWSLDDLSIIGNMSLDKCAQDLDSNPCLLFPRHGGGLT